MNVRRVLRHLWASDWQARRAFPRPALQAVENAIKASETAHLGEIRFVVEAALPSAALLAGQSARERAIEVFAHLRVWDTEHNNGVLIYLLLADRDVEIVADRGIDARVDAGEWEGICSEMESAFKVRRFEDGVIAGIRRVTELLARHFPADGSRANELPNQPVVL